MNGSINKNTVRETILENLSTLLLGPLAIQTMLFCIPNENESAAASIANCVKVNPRIRNCTSGALAKAPKINAKTPTNQNLKFCFTAPKLVFPAESIDEIASEKLYEVFIAMFLTGLGMNLTNLSFTFSYLSISSTVASVEKNTIAEVNPIKSKPTIAVPCCAIKSENSPTGSIAIPAKNACREEKPNKYVLAYAASILKSKLAKTRIAIIQRFCCSELKLMSIPMERKNMLENARTNG